MSPKFLICALFGVAMVHASTAAADTLTVRPATVRPGDPVLVTVTGSRGVPKGTANGSPLQFFAAGNGYQAVFAVGVDAPPGHLTVEVNSVAQPQTVEVSAVTFPETDVVVEDELANPSKPDRERINADNAASLHAVAKARGEPQFTRPFKRPPGEVNSA